MKERAPHAREEEGVVVEAGVGVEEITIMGPLSITEMVTMVGVVMGIEAEAVGEEVGVDTEVVEEVAMVVICNMSLVVVTMTTMKQKHDLCKAAGVDVGVAMVVICKMSLVVVSMTTMKQKYNLYKAAGVAVGVAMVVVVEEEEVVDVDVTIIMGQSKLQLLESISRFLVWMDACSGRVLINIYGHCVLGFEVCEVMQF